VGYGAFPEMACTPLAFVKLRRLALHREGMWIVRVALQRPYTFIVLALLILLAGPVLILRTPTDIFPNIDIPVIAVAWQFTGPLR